MASPLADQMLAAVDAVERECGMNAMLWEDRILGTVMEFALDGRLTAEEDLAEEAGILARIIPCSRDYCAEDLQEDRPIRLGGPCDRCMADRVPSVARVYVPAGASIVSVDVCRECRRALDEQFTPIRWHD